VCVCCSYVALCAVCFPRLCLCSQRPCMRRDGECPRLRTRSDEPRRQVVGRCSMEGLSSEESQHICQLHRDRWLSTSSRRGAQPAQSLSPPLAACLVPSGRESSWVPSTRPQCMYAHATARRSQPTSKSLMGHHCDFKWQAKREREKEISVGFLPLGPPSAMSECSAASTMQDARLEPGAIASASSFSPTQSLSRSAYRGDRGL